jgi:hypothetical protein
MQAQEREGVGTESKKAVSERETPTDMCSTLETWE